MPEAVVVTVTFRVHEAPAARVPPLNEIVCGAVVDNVPPHCEDDPVVTVRPLGRVSVKLIPVNAMPVFGFVTVNVNVEVEPAATGSGEKLLLIVEGEGVPQPVKITLSRFKSAPLLGVLAPKPYTLKYVMPVVLVCPVKSKGP